MEALLRASRRDFSPEVLDEIQSLGKRLSLVEEDRLRTPDLAALLRLSSDYRRRECIRALKAGALLLQADEGCTPWQAAGRLSDELDRFERRTLPMIRKDPDYPLLPLQERLNVVFGCHVQFPRSHEGLYRELY